MGEIDFNKYERRGAYHWAQISRHPMKRNSYVLGRYQNMLTLLRQEVGCLHGKKILDVGCGDGVLAYLIHREGASVFGVDFSDLAIHYARKKTAGSDIAFQQGSAYALPYSDCSFDVVISSDVIEHVQDVPAYLAEIKRVVRIGGKVIISTPIRITERPMDSMHVVEWFQTEFMNVVGAVFPGGHYCQSHPVVLFELMNSAWCGKAWGKVIFNVCSLVKNPFVGFDSRFRYMSLQYAVSSKGEP